MPKITVASGASDRGGERTSLVSEPGPEGEASAEGQAPPKPTPKRRKATEARKKD